MLDKKFSKTAKIDEGALKDMGWPNAGAVVQNVKDGKTPYKTAIQRLQYLVNIDSPAKTKAQALIVRLQKEVGGKAEEDQAKPAAPKRGTPPAPPAAPPKAPHPGMKNYGG